MSAPVTFAFDLENPKHREAVRLLAQHFEGHQDLSAAEPVHVPQPPKKLGPGSRTQRVKPPAANELPPDNVRPLVSAQVDEMATRKGAIKP